MFKASCARGTSLVELIIVVLIMGILALAASPRFGQVIARAKCESVARRVVSDINYARQIAMQSSKTTTVLFTATPSSYTMTNVPHPYRTGQMYGFAFREIDAAVKFTSVNIDSGTNLSFNAYGRPLKTATMQAMSVGTLIITFGSEQFTVTIDPSTGEATVS
jgi:prepilin-type N-terminal cleavage/methylation domain-containing protein